MINVVLDTDICNEVDDQFALAYLLKSLDIFNLKAITIAPFIDSNYSVKRYETIEDGINDSYDTTLQILNLLNYDSNNLVFKGSTDYMINGYNEDNDAVNRIIQVAFESDEKIYILAIAALTNIALAIKKEPRIIPKIAVVWLGGNSSAHEENNEFNFKDIIATQTVFHSGVELTVIPCRTVASHLSTTISELKDWGPKNSPIWDFLLDRFVKCKEIKPGTSKVLWDLSVIGYFIKKKCFYERIIKCPVIEDDGRYSNRTLEHNITLVYDMTRDGIYNDLFNKMNQLS